jgi:hypothetical protein
MWGKNACSTLLLHNRDLLHFIVDQHILFHLFFGQETAKSKYFVSYYKAVAAIIITIYLRHRELSKLYILRPVSLNLKVLFAFPSLSMSSYIPPSPNFVRRRLLSTRFDSSSSSHVILYLLIQSSIEDVNIPLASLRVTIQISFVSLAVLGSLCFFVVQTSLPQHENCFGSDITY